ncbi:MAG: hypothetical protein QM728_01670 [Gordonia sp. (in: high G+C Gram-positive bacteria)]|uniref:GNAT family N-acetyltransferase, cg3035/Rv0428c family n=1 Tax=Gordonia sp. (in: high G+C Gram-positive bacteria) TaxID=84139 RepID=UPI0039E375C8
MFAGDRVVVRYRLAPGAPGDWRGAGDATVSDVTGVVAGVEPDALVLTRVAPAALASADRVRVPRELITSVRLLPYRAVRNNEIRDVALRAMDAPDTATVDRWLARAGGAVGIDLASAVPAALGARLDGAAVDALRDWYAARGLPAVVELPERLVPGAEAGTPVGGEFHRLVRVDDDGAESDIVTVSADDSERGAALRADGFALHHRVTYRHLDG